MVKLIEPFSIFALIMAYIWDFRFTHHWAWLGILALMLISHGLRGERAAALGFERRNLGACLAEFAPFLAFLTLVLLAAGLLLQTIRPLRADQAFFALAFYLPWGLFQQYIVNGYFLNRFAPVVSRRAAPALSALLFSGAHLPNWFLMLVTLLLGYFGARIYMRHKNLYFLGMAHAMIGFLLFLVVPDSVSHHLIVGPRWFGH